jgi:arabinofuranosyltransferase
VQVVAVRPNIGLLGVAAGPHVRIIDLHGLSDPLAARIELLERGRPGHEKVISDAWVLARYGDSATATSPEIQAAGRALACEPLAELTKGIQEPLTPGRILDNIRLAWETRNLRIPADPLQAERQLC